MARRAANVSAAEKNLLVELVTQHAEVIENKETDKVTVSEKAAASKLVESEFNCSSVIHRSSDQLKQAYNNLKKAAKKVAAKDRVLHFKTGGGPLETSTTDVDAKVLALLGNRAEPLQNYYDSDATTSMPNTEVASGSAVLFLEVDAALKALTANDELQYQPVSECETDFAREPVLVDSLTSTIDPRASNAGQSGKVATVTATSESRAAATLASKKWAGRRRPRAYKGSATATATTDAADNISALAACQRSYYADNLEMARKEHDVRMCILMLQEEYEVKRLRKLEE